MQFDILLDETLSVFGVLLLIGGDLHILFIDQITVNLLR